jgi:general secretion pathway protein L
LSTTLYVRLPHRPHDQPQPWHFGALPFALVRAPLADKGKGRANRPAGTAPHLLREGHATIEAMPAADRLVLILAASDVLLTPATVPPLAPARLQLALPNLVEDVLAADAQPCHIAVGPALDEPPAGKSAARGSRRRLLMVTERAWLRAVLDAFAGHRHRARHVLPAQLCLPLSALDDAPVATLALEAAADPMVADTALLGADQVLSADRAAGTRQWQLTVRTGPAAGYGLLLGDDALAAWQALAPPGIWYGDRAAADAIAAVEPLSWQTWIEGAQQSLHDRSLDLAQFEFGQGRADRLNLRAWRWPAALAAGLLLVQLIGMNVHWLMLRNEQQRLQAAQTQALRAAFPQTPVVVDPPLQMRRQVEQLRVASGRSTPDDFLPLADRFAQAGRQLAPDALRALEYRGRTLVATLKPGTDTAALRSAARQAGLAMEEDQSTSDAARGIPGAVAQEGSRWTIKPAL